MAINNHAGFHYSYQFVISEFLHFSMNACLGLASASGSASGDVFIAPDPGEPRTGGRVVQPGNGTPGQEPEGPVQASRRASTAWSSSRPLRSQAHSLSSREVASSSAKLNTLTARTDWALASTGRRLAPPPPTTR